MCLQVLIVRYIPVQSVVGLFGCVFIIGSSSSILPYVGVLNGVLVPAPFLFVANRLSMCTEIETSQGISLIHSK